MQQVLEQKRKAASQTTSESDAPKRVATVRFVFLLWLTTDVKLASQRDFVKFPSGCWKKLGQTDVQTAWIEDDIQSNAVGQFRLILLFHTFGHGRPFLQNRKRPSRRRIWSRRGQPCFRFICSLGFLPSLQLPIAGCVWTIHKHCRRTETSYSAVHNRMTRQQILDLYFMDARAKVIDLAAFMDRVERAEGEEDFRMKAFREALQELEKGNADRAKRVLLSLSDPTTEPIPAATTKAACGAWLGNVERNLS